MGQGRVLHHPWGKSEENLEGFHLVSWQSWIPQGLAVTSISAGP